MTPAEFLGVLPSSWPRAGPRPRPGHAGTRRAGSAGPVTRHGK
jgi:hypothetical protein